MRDQTKAVATLIFAVIGVIAIMTYAVSAKAFTATEAEAQHCGVEGGCVLISQQRLRSMLEQYAERAYENGLNAAKESCRMKI